MLQHTNWRVADFLPTLPSEGTESGEILKMSRARFALPLALGALGSCCALADQVTLFPTKDNTIFSEGQLSNAQGSIFSGRTNQGAIRRGLIAFDIASAIPAGSVIEDVTLNFNVSKTNFGGNQSLHRLLADWGEGTSNAGSAGFGALATEGDATWLNTFFSATNPASWTTPGGDFVSDASSSTFVPSFTFDTPAQFASSPLMVQDVQHWLDAGGNFGWLIQGDENTASTSRFDSREAFIAEDKPFLTIQFSAAGGPPQWNVDADGSWGVAGNWSSNSVPDSPTAIANFLGKTTAPRTITLDGDRTVGTINFNSFVRYTIATGSGGTLTLGGPGSPGSITVNPATHEISAKIVVAGNSTMNVAGDGRLILSGGLQINNNAPLLMTGDGDLTLSGPQTHQNGATLTINNLRLANNSNSGAAADATTPAPASSCPR